MAKTASAAVLPTTVAAQAAATVTVTATNNDSDAYITAVRPKCYPTGLSMAAGCACAIGNSPTSLTSGSGLLVAGSGGTNTVAFGVNVFVPQGASAANQTWVVGADLYWSTGEVTAASTANLTVTHMP